jgi:hypothetical protein
LKEEELLKEEVSQESARRAVVDVVYGTWLDVGRGGDRDEFISATKKKFAVGPAVPVPTSP